MQHRYKFRHFPVKTVDVVEEIVSVQHQRPIVPPITHSEYTATMRTRAEKESKKAMGDLKEEDEKGMSSKGGFVERAKQHLSSQGVAALTRYQTDMWRALKKVSLPLPKP